MPWKNGNPPSYTVWRGILHRCYNPKAKQYKDYGGRGITVCNAWRYSYKQFYADMGDHPPGLTIERRDNDGNYTPKNCYWATRKEQQRNHRNTIKVIVEGKEYLAMDLAAIAGIKTDCLVERVKKGLTYEEVIAKEKTINLEGFKLGPKASSIARKSKTHCSKGHEFTPENTHFGGEGKYIWRVCRACRNERARRAFAKKRS